MAQTDLEFYIKELLIERGIAEKERTPFYYKVPESYRWYRQARAYAKDNMLKLSLAGLVATGIVGLTFRNLAGVITASSMGLASMAGLLRGIGGLYKPLDDMLLRNANVLSGSIFSDTHTVGLEALYDNIKIKKKRDLDELVLMSQNPEAIRLNHSHSDDDRAFGISASRTADILSEISGNGGVTGLKTKHLLAMLERQKSGEKKANPDIYELLNKYPRQYLVQCLAEECTVDKKDQKAFEKLKDLFSNYEFTLQIHETQMTRIGAQLSRGYIVLDGYARSDIGCYMGYHSTDKDLPRITVKGDVGPAFMTKALRGFGIVQGDAYHKFMEGASGGIGIVDGMLVGKLRKQDDSTYPMVIYSEGGFTRRRITEENGIKNGLFVSLGEDDRIFGGADIIRVRKGVVDPKSYDNLLDAEREAKRQLNEYILHEWKPRIAA